MEADRSAACVHTVRGTRVQCQLPAGHEGDHIAPNPTEDVRDVWPGHTAGELEAYRSGFADALAWALRHEPEEIEAVLNVD